MAGVQAGLAELLTSFLITVGITESIENMCIVCLARRW